MSSEQIAQLLREGLYLVLLLSAPAVVVSLVVGLIVSLLQATTQLQDHTLSFVPKLVAVLLTLAVAGGWIGTQLVSFTEALLSSVPLMR